MNLRPSCTVLFVAFGLEPACHEVGPPPMSDTLEVQPVARFGCCGSLAFSPDGMLLATTGSAGLTLWDVQSGLALRTIFFRTQQVRFTAHGAVSTYYSPPENGLAFSPDGAYVSALPPCTVASEHWPKPIDVWEIDSGKPVGEPKWVGELGAGLRNDTLPWTWRELLAWRASHDPGVVRRLARYNGSTCPISSDGHVGIALLREAGDPWITGIEVLRLETGRRTSLILPGKAYRATLSPDGRFVAALTLNRELKVYEAATGRERDLHTRGPQARSYAVRRFTAEDRTETMAFSQDGSSLAVFAQEAILVFETTGMREVRRIPVARPRILPTLAFSSDGKWLAVGEFDVRIWDVGTGREMQRLLTAGREISSLAFSRDGQNFVYGTSEPIIPGEFGYGNSRGLLKLWTLSGGSLSQTLADHRNTVQQVAFAMGPRLVVASSDPAVSARSSGQEGEVTVWHPETAERIRSVAPWGWESSARAIATSPDGRIVAAAVYQFRPEEIESGSEISAWTHSTLSSFVCGKSRAAENSRPLTRGTRAFLPSLSRHKAIDSGLGTTAGLLFGIYEPVGCRKSSGQALTDFRGRLLYAGSPSRPTVESWLPPARAGSSRSGTQRRESACANSAATEWPFVHSL